MSFTDSLKIVKVGLKVEQMYEKDFAIFSVEKIHFVLRFSFSWRNWKVNYKQININFMIIFISMVYTLLKSKFASGLLTFSAMQWSCGHQESVAFHVYITGCYFNTSLTLIVNYNIKHISKNSHYELSL